MSGAGGHDMSVVLISLTSLEKRLAELTDDMSRLAHILEKESEGSSKYTLMAGCLECLLEDRLKPACEALAMLRSVEVGDDSPDEPRESSWPA